VFQVPAVQFAVASDSNYAFSGILGLGYTFPYSIPYPSVLNLMVAQNLIGAPIFSLGLGGTMDGFSECAWRYHPESVLKPVTDHKAGEIIFGGVNRWKFAGALEPVPIWPPISKQNPNWIQYVL
jgi:hypothetical protein